MSAWFNPVCGRASSVSSILTATTGLLDGFSPVSGLIAGAAGAAPCEDDDEDEDDGAAVDADCFGLPLELLQAAAASNAASDAPIRAQRRGRGCEAESTAPM